MQFAWRVAGAPFSVGSQLAALLRHVAVASDREEPLRGVIAQDERRKSHSPPIGPLNEFRQIDAGRTHHRQKLIGRIGIQRQH